QGGGAAHDVDVQCRIIRGVHQVNAQHDRHAQGTAGVVEFRVGEYGAAVRCAAPPGVVQVAHHELDAGLQEPLAADQNIRAELVTGAADPLLIAGLRHVGTV